MITIDKLARAIEKRLSHPRAEAFAQAHRVMDYFGFRTLITDNTIPPNDRRLFYALYDVGLLRSSGETVSSRAARPGASSIGNSSRRTWTGCCGSRRCRRSPCTPRRR